MELRSSAEELTQSTSSSILASVSELPNTTNSPDLHGVRQLSEVERSWLAGVIDGEGSIHVSKLTADSRTIVRRDFSYVPVINLSSSSQEFATKVKEVIGKGSVNFVEEKRLNWKDRWCYSGASNVLRGLLPQVIPKLLIKREVAEKVLEYVTFIEANPVDGFQAIPAGYYEKIDSLYLEIKKLNKKGDDSKSTELMNTRPDTLAKGGPGRRTTSCRQLNQEERTWLAGVVDGEGSILLSKVIDSAYRRGFFYRPQFDISNSNREFLVKAQQIIGEGTVYLAKRGTPGTKTRWEYIAVAGVLRSILPQIVPYLIVKHSQAETMLRYFTYIDENSILGIRIVNPEYYVKLDRLYRSMKELNEKGKPRK
jgi:hypothetical protein